MRDQTIREEFWNTITHSFGFVLSLLGFILLLIYVDKNSPQAIFGTILYGSSLGILYLVSSLYHYSKNEKRKRILQTLDHISIYLLIAGTYSPVVLITLPQSNGWILFWIVWTIAALGTILKIFYTGRFEVLSLLLYLIMGWLIIFDFDALQQNVDQTGIILLILGGVAYTVGIVFYVLQKMKYNHVIWHLFVLAGSIFHFLFIFLKVI